jgi:hypothetical protein
MNTIGRRQQILDAWDQALGNKDATAAAALYVPDATLESPLVLDPAAPSRRPVSFCRKACHAAPNDRRIAGFTLYASSEESVLAGEIP